jgi:hypothetical protein
MVIALSCSAAAMAALVGSRIVGFSVFMVQRTEFDDRSIASQQSASPQGVSLPQAQEIIYDFLLELVKTCPPDEVLQEFRHLFIHHDDSSGADTIPALHIILFANNEAEFHNTLKRSCYILVNNWEVSRQFDAMQALVELFKDPLLYRHTFSPTLKRLRHWLLTFIESQDFQDLKLFAARYTQARGINRPGEWTNRYATYLLVPQYINAANPIEQRRAARALSRRLKDQFKFDLAMYTAYSQAPLGGRKQVENPTDLGDSTLRLIKAIVAKRGEFSYKNLAHLFLQQVKHSHYAYFKQSLPFYLLYTVRGNDTASLIQDHLTRYLETLYPDCNQQRLDHSLLLRTCNRLIDWLITEDRVSPSDLFCLVLSRGNALTLAIILLKLILISRGSNLYLEVRLADLIQYYQQFSKAKCQWVINFLEVFRVTFAIYAENIEYNLIRVDPDSPQTSPDPFPPDLPSAPANEDLATFRIFSQMLYYPIGDNGLDLPPE